VPIQTLVCLYRHGETPAPEGVGDERPGAGLRQSAEHTEPEANVRQLERGTSGRKTLRTVEGWRLLTYA
jgi:hypothetical protein